MFHIYMLQEETHLIPKIQRLTGLKDASPREAAFLKEARMAVNMLQLSQGSLAKRV